MGWNSVRPSIDRERATHVAEGKIGARVAK
jgi:hypothetical protein